jgi:cytochrome c556
VRKPLILLGALATLAVPALAADDPIAARQALMRNNGAAAGVAGPMMKGELAYSPAVGRAAIAAWNATAQTIGDYFPEGSVDEAKSTASPKIWEDMAGFQAALGKFQEATAAAVQASGKDGPPDAAAFTAAAEPVLGTCKTCHDTYRIQQQ